MEFFCTERFDEIIYFFREQIQLIMFCTIDATYKTGISLIYL